MNTGKVFVFFLFIKKNSYTIYKIVVDFHDFFFEYISFNAYQSVQQQIEQEEQSLRIPRAVSKQPEELAKVEILFSRKTFEKYIIVYLQKGRPAKKVTSFMDIPKYLRKSDEFSSIFFFLSGHPCPWIVCS